MNNYKDIIDAAIKARSNAYAPYSNFLVGAAAKFEDGSIVLGCNVENISYGLSNCAERSCLFSCISQGYDTKKIVEFCIVGSTEDPISPCGACRQVMFELLDPNTTIILSNLKGQFSTHTVKELLPLSFKEIEHVI